MPCMLIGRVSYEYAAVATTFGSQSRIRGVTRGVKSDVLFTLLSYGASLTLGNDTDDITLQT